jgi:hypothetical protein
MIDYCEFAKDWPPECGSSEVIKCQYSMIGSESCRVSIQPAGYLTALCAVVACGKPGGFFLPGGVFLRPSDIRQAAASVPVSAPSM